MNVNIVRFIAFFIVKERFRMIIKFGVKPTKPSCEYNMRFNI